MNTIQGANAVLQFMKDEFLPFMCASSFSIEIDADILPTSTVGDGQWKKVNYQKIGYIVTLSGVLVFDDDNVTGWDLLDNMINFVQVPFRVTFDDKAGHVRTIQGIVAIDKTTLGSAVSDVVKDDFSLTGSGPLMIFDGLVPCAAVIETITVTGQAASDGIAHFAYTYSGSIFQIKYRVDNTGSYIYVAADTTIDYPGLPIGSHSVEIIPVCQNGYEGTGLVQAFTISQALTCSSVINSITISGTPLVASNTRTGAATQMKYRIDGGSWINSLITTPVPVSGLSIGNHTIEEVPICANGVEGTGTSQAFNVPSQPAQSTINFSASNSTTNGMQFQIFQDGVLIRSFNTSPSAGTLNVPTGSVVKATIGLNGTQGRTVQMIVEDVTTTTTLYNNTQFMNNSAMQFIFTANGDEFSITATIT